MNSRRRVNSTVGRLNHLMKGLFLFALGLLLIAAACDPGMTIYQTNSNQNTSAPERVTVRVKASHPLIGETWYAPDNDVTITNSLDKPIVITKVELVTNRTTYQHKHTGATNEYPLTVAAGKKEIFPSWFELNNNVQEKLKKPPQFRVNYTNSPAETVTHAIIFGGPAS